MTTQEPVLLVITQVYVPDPSSVGQHMADAAEALAGRGHRVVVLTSARGYENPKVKYPRRERRAGVDVVRLPLSSFGKSSLVHRLLGQGLFLLQVIVRGLFARRLSGILVSTSPPMASSAALLISFMRRVPITYWLMDLNPDQIVAQGKATGRNPLVLAMRWLNRRIYSRAGSVIVLDRYMAERVKRQYRVRGRMEIIPPWPHVDASLRDADASLGETRPRERSPANPFRAEHNPDGRFVVMYSGNHSPASPVTTLLQAALRLRDDPRFLFMFIGGGLGKREVDETIAASRQANILSLPYQPLERIKHSLAAADLHVVTLGNGMVGIIHPCKIYGAMAAGRPVLVIGPQPSHASDLAVRHEIGWHVEQGDVEGVVGAIRRAAEMPAESRAAIGRRARAAVREHYGKDRLCAAFCDVVERGITSADAASQRGDLPAVYLCEDVAAAVRDSA